MTGIRWTVVSAAFALLLSGLSVMAGDKAGGILREDAGPSLYLFNRAPLAPKPYAELPLGTIEARGWLLEQLKRMADGMTGHLDAMYAEVVGPRNAWLGGDGDAWERGPYWIDGLYPLAIIVKDGELRAKAARWVEWTLQNQREDGYIGPRPTPKPPQREPGLQRDKQEDWWPRMVMLKVLQQYYQATGDRRVIDCLLRYSRYQLDTLPQKPLDHWSWWGRQRGGDNLMVVLWLYNVTGEKWLLDLARLLEEQTLPVTSLFLEGEALKLRRNRSGGVEHDAFHCVNLAQAMKTPLVTFQLDGDPRHMEATRKAFRDIEILHGQPHGLYGADEGMHGRDLDRGSELCTAVEMMYSLERMLEISGEVEFADRLEKVAFNPLPSQISDDCLTRQYFQQANQVEVTYGQRSFFNGGDGERLVYGLLNGYPCCTCNLHQGWPKFVAHLWMASADRGLAALAFGPCRVTARVANGQDVTIVEETGYPFEETIRFRVQSAKPVTFPLHLRIPGWCEKARIAVDGQTLQEPAGGKVVTIDRQWANGAVLELVLPMKLKKSFWHERSVAVERGPLVFALRVEERWSNVRPEDKMGYRECRPASPWNYALLAGALADMEKGFEVVKADKQAPYPWSLQDAPIELRTKGVRLPRWTLYDGSAGRVPMSPQDMPDGAQVEQIRLIPYGCTTLRVAGFPWVKDGNVNPARVLQ